MWGWRDEIQPIPGALGWGCNASVQESIQPGAGKSWDCLPSPEGLRLQGSARGRGTEQCQGLAELREVLARAPTRGIGMLAWRGSQLLVLAPAPALGDALSSTWCWCPAGLVLPAHPQPHSALQGRLEGSAN